MDFMSQYQRLQQKLTVFRVKSSFVLERCSKHAVA